MWQLLLSWSTESVGFPGCGTWAHSLQFPGSRTQAQYFSAHRFVAPRHGGSSRMRDRTCISCIGRRFLYHWATRKALQFFFNQKFWARFLAAFLPKPAVLPSAWVADWAPSGVFFQERDVPSSRSPGCPNPTSASNASQVPIAAVSLTSDHKQRVSPSSPFLFPLCAARENFQWENCSKSCQDRLWTALWYFPSIAESSLDTLLYARHQDYKDE